MQLFINEYSVFGMAVTNARTVATRKVGVRDRDPNRAREYRTKKGIFRTYQVLWYFLGIVEVMLALRFVFRMTGANPASLVVSAIYSTSSVFVAPFRTIFPTTAVTDAAVVEWTTLVAMLLWALLIWGVVKLLQLVKPVDPDEVEEGVNSQ